MISSTPLPTRRRSAVPRRGRAAVRRAASHAAVARPAPAAAAVPAPAPAPAPAEDAFALAVAAEYEKLHRRALRLTRDPDRAGDLTQETVARALRFRDKFAPGTNLHAWLQTMLGNLWLSEFRRARFTASAPESIRDEGEGEDFFSRVPAPAAQTPQAEAERGELRRVLGGALVRLPQVYRWPLRLFLEEGRSYEQIAGDLRIPVGTVMSRIFRARKLLQQDLGGRLPGHLLPAV